MLSSKRPIANPLSLLPLAVLGGVLLAATPPATGQTALSLNVYFSDPADAASGGSWELSVKSSDGSSVVGLLAVLHGIDDPAGTLLDPTGTHSLSGTAPLFRQIENQVYEILYAQDPSVELVNGVGLSEGAFAQPDALGSPAWDGNSIVVSGGTFSALAPSFAGSIAANTLATSGDLLEATFVEMGGAATPVVRYNLNGQGDYNSDGVVNAADYTLWRDSLGTDASWPGDPTPGSVLSSDYIVWRTNFGSPGLAGVIDRSAEIYLDKSAGAGRLPSQLNNPNGTPSNPIAGVGAYGIRYDLPIETAHLPTDSAVTTLVPEPSTSAALALFSAVMFLSRSQSGSPKAISPGVAVHRNNTPA